MARLVGSNGNQSTPTVTRTSNRLTLGAFTSKLHGSEGLRFQTKEGRDVYEAVRRVKSAESNIATCQIRQTLETILKPNLKNMVDALAALRTEIDLAISSPSIQERETARVAIRLLEKYSSANAFEQLGRFEEFNPRAEARIARLQPTITQTPGQSATPQPKTAGAKPGIKTPAVPKPKMVEVNLYVGEEPKISKGPKPAKESRAPKPNAGLSVTKAKAPIITAPVRAQTAMPLTEDPTVGWGSRPIEPAPIVNVQTPIRSRIDEPDRKVKGPNIVIPKFF